MFGEVRVIRKKKAIDIEQPQASFRVASNNITGGMGARSSQGNSLLSSFSPTVVDYDTYAFASISHAFLLGRLIDLSYSFLPTFKPNHFTQ